jgi:hypothetical protein
METGCKDGANTLHPQKQISALQCCGIRKKHSQRFGQDQMQSPLL